MFNNILVVCVGNICRSPTAERLLQRYHPELKVESAGLGALVGKGLILPLSASPQNINCLWKVTVPVKSAAACVATTT